MFFVLLAIGTSAGTTISNQITTGTGLPSVGEAVVVYESGSNTLGAKNADSVTTTVIQGYEVNDLNTVGDQSGSPSDSLTFGPYQVTNQSNGSDSLFVQVRYITMVQSGTNDWKIEILDSGGSPVSSANWDTSTHPDVEHSFTVSSDGLLQFYIRVTIPSDAADCDYCTFGVRVNANNQDPGSTGVDVDDWPPDHPVAGFTFDGDTDTVEADSHDEEDYTNERQNTATCAVPYIHVAKEVSGATGGNVLPFSELTYTIKFDNDGSGQAQNLRIIEHVCGSGEHVDYVVDSAEGSNSPPTGLSFTIEYSTDGTTWNSDTHDNTVDADSDTYVEDSEVTDYYIRWSLNGNLPGHSSNGGSDTTSSCDGPIPDDDAGLVKYTVLVE